jgi:hypothetical protein
MASRLYGGAHACTMLTFKIVGASKSKLARWLQTLDLEQLSLSNVAT